MDSTRKDAAKRALGALAALSLIATGAVAARAESGKPATIAGKIRSYGFGLGGVLVQWQKAFQERHPNVSFENTLPTSDAAFPALVTNVTDLAPNGGEPALTEALSFFETRGYHASSVVVGSGSFDREGRSNGPVVFVSEANPLTQLTVDQLDGIFGSERSGGLRGFEWTKKGARGPDKNIRFWRDLGVSGRCADRPIETYGHGPSGTTRFFQLHVLENTDKWNPNYRGYVETGSKQIPAEERAESALGARSMLGEIAKNPCAIGWSIMSQAAGIAGLKAVAIAARGTRTFVLPSEKSFRDRTYPLVRNIYIYFDRAPGKPLAPRLKAFLAFALSPEGQKRVEEGGYLPLPASMTRDQLQRIE